MKKIIFGLFVVFEMIGIILCCASCGKRNGETEGTADNNAIDQAQVDTVSSDTEENNYGMTGDITGEPTLPGAEVLYPTVMVDGKLYEWRRGSAILNAYIKDDTFFLNNSDYYGEIKKTEKKRPEADCELTCLFDVEGKIYTIPDEKYIYLVLTTDWLEDAIVVFDEIE